MYLVVRQRASRHLAPAASRQVKRTFKAAVYAQHRVRYTYAARRRHAVVFVARSVVLRVARSRCAEHPLPVRASAVAAYRPPGVVEYKAQPQVVRRVRRMVNAVVAVLRKLSRGLRQLKTAAVQLRSRKLTDAAHHPSVAVLSICDRKASAAFSVAKSAQVSLYVVAVACLRSVRVRDLREPPRSVVAVARHLTAVVRHAHKVALCVVAQLCDLHLRAAVRLCVHPNYTSGTVVLDRLAVAVAVADAAEPTVCERPCVVPVGIAHAVVCTALA